jgi:hypothetical protein
MCVTKLMHLRQGWFDDGLRIVGPKRSRVRIRIFHRSLFAVKFEIKIINNNTFHQPVDHVEGVHLDRQENNYGTEETTSNNRE